MNSTRIEKQRYTRRNRRIIMIGGFFSVLYVLIGLKAFYLQVIKDDDLSEKASSQYQKNIQGRGKRGSIYDADYRELAVSADVVEIGVHPQSVRGKENKKIEDRRKLAGVVAGALKMNANFLYKKFKSTAPFVWIDRRVTPAKASALKALGFRGFEYFPTYCRVYPQKALAAQVIGFSGTDGDGLEGLEQYYDEDLKGNIRQWTIIRDAMGRIFDRHESCAPGYEGNNLILTIDATIQYIAEKALKKSVQENNAKDGVAIVMDPETGAIKAIANYPSYNPNSFNLFPKETWRNKALTDPFEPGSTMKIFLVAAALESGMCNPETVINCESGQYRIGRNVIHDTHSHDDLTVHDVIKYSSNIGAAKIAEMIGPAALYNTLRNFGFGEKTGIDCPGESKGLLRNYQSWKKIDNATIAFGQGISVSAIQLISAISAVANNGVLMKPYIVKAITDEHGKIIKSFAPIERRNAIMPDTADALIEMMHAVTERDGTGWQAVPVGYTVCGKTGTAQKLNARGTYRNCEYNGLFVGFSPARSPVLAVLVVIDEPQKHHYGGVVAAPVFKEIVHETFNYLNIAPTSTKEQLNVSNGLGKRGGA